MSPNSTPFQSPVSEPRLWPRRIEFFCGHLGIIIPRFHGDWNKNMIEMGIEIDIYVYRLMKIKRDLI